MSLCLVAVLLVSLCLVTVLLVSLCLVTACVPLPCDVSLCLVTVLLASLCCLCHIQEQHCTLHFGRHVARGLWRCPGCRVHWSGQLHLIPTLGLWSDHCWW